VSRGWVVIRVRDGRLQFLGQNGWLVELLDEALVEDERTAERLVREPGESRVSWEMAERMLADEQGDQRPLYPIELGGARWAADGACCIREGTPLPAQYTDDSGKVWPWLGAIPADKTPNYAQAALAAVRHGRVRATRVHERFRALLRAADHVDRVMVGDESGERSIVRCWRGEEIYALIAPMDGGDGTRIDVLLAAGEQ
jgi:hypothetical protein